MTKARDKPMPAPVKSTPTRPQTVLTTAAGKIGPFGYGIGLLITDVPPEALDANAAWMSADAEAVKAAKAAGADTVPYRS